MSEQDGIERLKNTGRNDQCPCGSGKKYKKCHLAEDTLTQQKTVQEHQPQQETTEDTDEVTITMDKQESKVPRFTDQVKGKFNKHSKTTVRSNAPRRQAGI